MQKFTLKKCEHHKISYDLIGNDKFCELNCLICCDCLRTLDHQHKFEGINHKTITMQQLTQHFNKIREFSKKQILRTHEKLDQYMKNLMEKLQQQINQEKTRIQELIENIMLTQISKKQDELATLEHLYHGRYDQLICKQVGGIAKKLFSFVPSKISPGYRKMQDYIDQRITKINDELQQLYKDPHYQNVALRDVSPTIKYPEFEDTPPMSRVKTEEPSSPKKTPRRSLRKERPIQSPVQKSLLDIKDIHVKIKKPLQFRDSELVKSKQDTSFIEKLFPQRVYGAKMLYRASDNNFSVKRFHQYCDGEPNTIVFVRTEFNKIIGGFTPIPWRSTNNTVHSDTKKQSFLFSISLKQKMQLVDEKAAIFNSLNFGPTFGSGADLAICHKSNVEKTSYAQFPYSYANSRYLDKNQHSTFLFTGQQNGNHFLIREWEVWKLDFN